MHVTVELTYDMAKEYGATTIDVQNVNGVAELIDVVKERLGAKFEHEAQHAAVAVNGVLVNHRQGKRTRLKDGDWVSFVKAAAGG